jgi:hypothetical protein
VGLVIVTTLAVRRLAACSDVEIDVIGARTGRGPSGQADGNDPQSDRHDGRDALVSHP